MSPQCFSHVLTIPEKTVVIRLMGGLGNQMFQYALGKAVSQRIGYRLMLDTYFFKSKQLSARHYELHHFHVPEKTIDVITYIRMKYGWLPTIHEPHFHYWEGVFTPPPHTCYRLSGYWQSEKYFKDIAQDIRACFAMERFSSPQTRALETSIRHHPHAVCVHVRRGDMMYPQVHLYHGSIKRDYYDKARALLEKKYAPCHFFIFTDEYDYVRQEFSDWRHTTFVHGFNHYQDMMLMTLFPHYIIGNSSYSWWGVWLNSLSQKDVIAPQQWFSPILMKTHHLKDLYGDDWTIL